MVMFDPITARPGPDFTPRLIDISSMREGKNGYGLKIQEEVFQMLLDGITEY